MTMVVFGLSPSSGLQWPVISHVLSLTGGVMLPTDHLDKAEEEEERQREREKRGSRCSRALSDREQRNGTLWLEL